MYVYNVHSTHFVNHACDIYDELLIMHHSDLLVILLSQQVTEVWPIIYPEDLHFTKEQEMLLKAMQ